MGTPKGYDPPNRPPMCKPSTDSYREGWDRIFGKKKKDKECEKDESRNNIKR